MNHDAHYYLGVYYANTRAAMNTPSGEYDMYHEYVVPNMKIYSQIQTVIINKQFNRMSIL